MSGEGRIFRFDKQEKKFSVYKTPVAGLIFSKKYHFCVFFLIRGYRAAKNKMARAMYISKRNNRVDRPELRNYYINKETATVLEEK